MGIFDFLDRLLNFSPDDKRKLEEESRKLEEHRRRIASLLDPSSPAKEDIPDRERISYRRHHPIPLLPPEKEDFAEETPYRSPLEEFLDKPYRGANPSSHTAERMVMLYRQVRGHALFHLPGIQRESQLDNLINEICEEISEEQQRSVEYGECVISRGDAKRYIGQLLHIKEGRAPLHEKKAAIRGVVGQLQKSTAVNLGLYLAESSPSSSALLDFPSRENAGREGQRLQHTLERESQEAYDAGYEYLKARGLDHY